MDNERNTNFVIGNSWRNLIEKASIPQHKRGNIKDYNSMLKKCKSSLDKIKSIIYKNESGDRINNQNHMESTQTHESINSKMLPKNMSNGNIYDYNNGLSLYEKMCLNQQMYYY